jgi:sugar lactone lactonase YvrE
VKKLAGSVFLALPLVVSLFSAPSPLHGQAVTFTGTAVNFGDVAICAPGKTTPAPCSETLTLKYSVTVGGTLGVPKVLTLGAPNLDFTLAGSTCTGNVATGAPCTVEVTLAPKFPGLRAGAVLITDGSGNVLTTTFLRGVGLGPQIAFDGAPQIKAVENNIPNTQMGGLAVDGAGDLLFANGEHLGEGQPPQVFERPVRGGLLRLIGSDLSSPQAVALDGAGSAYITDSGTNLVVKVPPGCEQTGCQTLLDGGFDLPAGIAVDGAGNVYVADSGNNRVVEMPAGCANRSCVLPVGSGLNDPYAVALDGSENIFILDFSNHRVVRVPAGGGTQATVVSNLPLSYGIAVDAAGDLFITDRGNGRILEAPAGSGALVTLASGLGRPYGLTLDAGGNVFYSDFASEGVLGVLQRGESPSHVFGTTVVGGVSSDSPQAYTVENSGNAMLSLSGLTVGTDSNFIQVAGPGTPIDCHGSLSLAPGASCDLSISFTPAMEGSLTGAAVLTDNTLNATDATQTVLLAGTAPSGPFINFQDGFSSAAAELALNGGATVLGTALQLTDGGANESRSAFFTTPIGLASFQTAFDFQLTGKDTPAPDGEGFTFVVQAEGLDALGSAGGGLGYGLPGVGQSGPKINHSVAVKFDLHSNDGEGTSSTGFYVDGAAPTVPSINTLPNLVDLHNGHVFHATLEYAQATVTLVIQDKTAEGTFVTELPIDIAGFLGRKTGYAGFTASTGAETAVENILDWQLTSSTCCISGMPTFPDGFSADSALALNGYATISEGTLELAQDTASEASSAFFSTAVPVNRFVSDFDFRLSRGDGDGFTFVLQSEGLHAIGTGGGGLGYGPSMPGGDGARIANSVAVKFDLHSNAGEGSDSTGVYVGGASPTVPSTNLTPSGIHLHSGHTFHARLIYDGANLTVSITDRTVYAVFNGTYAVDIPTAVGGMKAYAGFTAGTGDSYDTVKILDWNMASY